jgi:diguanylate cyclase (GGDEF)-like protein
MNTFLVILLIAAMLATVVALVRGVIAFLQDSHAQVRNGEGPSAASLKSNKMMQMRVFFQALAILIIVVTLAVLTIALLTSVLDARLESRTAKLARSLAEANEELTQMVLHDHLTKLPNRTLLEDRLTQAINKAARSNGHFALMFMDLDGFKAINDSLGHHVGDRLLVEVARRLTATTRAHDTVARLGGDEFVILVDLTLPDDAMPVAEKLVEAVNQPFRLGEHELRVSASIGIALASSAEIAPSPSLSALRRRSPMAPSMRPFMRPPMATIISLWAASASARVTLPSWSTSTWSKCLAVMAANSARVTTPSPSSSAMANMAPGPPMPWPMPPPLP